MSVEGYLRDVSEPENYFEVYAGRVTVGRADSNDIKIASRSVSSNHAEIEIEPSVRPSKMLVTDLRPAGLRHGLFFSSHILLFFVKKINKGDTKYILCHGFYWQGTAKTAVHQQYRPFQDS